MRYTTPPLASTLVGTALPSGIVSSSLTSFGSLAADLLFIDNLYDIGKSGATRPRDLFLSRNLTVAGVSSISTLSTTTPKGAGGGPLTVANTTSASGKVVATFAFSDATPNVALDFYCSVNQEFAMQAYKTSDGAPRDLYINPTGNSVKLATPLKTISTGAAAVNGQATLAAGGTVTVNTTAVSATSRIFVQRVTAGGTIGFATTITKVNGTSFTITSDNALDRSVYDWYIIESF